MKMINRETILNILAQNHEDDDGVAVDCLFRGLLIISKYFGSVRVEPIKTDDDIYTVKTIALDSMLAYNFSEEDVEKLHGLGWFIYEEYLTLERTG